jgi:hypothetical protein
MQGWRRGGIGIKKGWYRDKEGVVKGNGVLVIGFLEGSYTVIMLY